MRRLLLPAPATLCHPDKCAVYSMASALFAALDQTAVSRTSAPVAAIQFVAIAGAFDAVNVHM